MATTKSPRSILSNALDPPLLFTNDEHSAARYSNVEEEFSGYSGQRQSDAGMEENVSNPHSSLEPQKNAAERQWRLLA